MHKIDDGEDLFLNCLVDLPEKKMFCLGRKREIDVFFLFLFFISKYKDLHWEVKMSV